MVFTCGPYILCPSEANEQPPYYFSEAIATIMPIYHYNNVIYHSKCKLSLLSFKKIQLKTNPNFPMWCRGGVKLEFVQNSFDSIRKIAIRLIRKGKKYSKNSMKINSKFVRFDSTPTIGWSQIFQMLDSFEIRSIRFENL